MTLQIKSSKKNRPPRIGIYGTPGIGKSTFASQAENPIFISPEGGLDELDCSEMAGIRSFKDVQGAIQSLITGAHNYKTLVLDSADWIEKLAHAQIMGTSGKSIITCSGGYGAGYRESEKIHRELIESLSELREKREMSVIITAHAGVKAVKDPEAMHDYDAFQIKCHEFVSSLWVEWLDALLFARVKTFTKESENTDKVVALSTGERIVYTESRPAFQAKNRYGLPFEMPLSFEKINTAILKRRIPDVTVEEILTEIRNGISQIEDSSLVEKVCLAVQQAGTDTKSLVAIRTRLQILTKKAG